MEKSGMLLIQDLMDRAGILEEATPEEKYWVTYTVKGIKNERNDER